MDIVLLDLFRKLNLRRILFIVRYYCSILVVLF